MAKVCINDVRKLIEKSGQIREKLCLGTHRIGNVHIGGPMSACDVATACLLYTSFTAFFIFMSRPKVETNKVHWNVVKGI